MPIYKEKPIIIEAHRITRENIVELAIWCAGKVEPVEDPMWIEVYAAQHHDIVGIGDYIVKDIGDFYPYAKETFEKLYDEVTNDDFLDGDPYEGKGRPFRDNS